MSITVVLAVGLDSTLHTEQSSLWKSAGFFVMETSSIREAITHFKSGDFDLVLLGDSIAMAERERLAFLIRASGSRTPVVCVADASGGCDAFADATLQGDPHALIKGMEGLLAKRANMRLVQARAFSVAS